MFASLRKVASAVLAATAAVALAACSGGATPALPLPALLASALSPYLRLLH